MRIAIIGAGIAGLSTAWSLVKRGHEVTVFEQGTAIPNPLSASGDEHRLIRRAYAGADGYARLITEAFEAWDELWADLGKNHYAERGILIVSQTEGDQADGFRLGLDRTGFAYEAMNPAEAEARWPFLDAATIRYAILSREGGVLLCQRIARDLAAWLQARGAVLRANSRVMALDTEEGTIELESGETLTFDRVLVTAGAWVLKLFPEFQPVLFPYRTAVAYLRPPERFRVAWETAPAMLDVGGAVDGYCVPPVDGTGLKVGSGIGGHKRCTDNPDAERIAEPGEGEFLRDLFGPPFHDIADYAIDRVVTCAYTFTADERFFGAARGKALVVSACSGHAYKFGAAIGRRVAEAVDSGDSDRLAAWLRAELAR